uniref:Uncharacterized protein n=1 Tax=Trichobilharzia regenti TaxID=157069 RepID=A0AA85IWI1_TRIRE|nr:unnamed protein product [Trichobilharzia regenti]
MSFTLLFVVIFVDSMICQPKSVNLNTFSGIAYIHLLIYTIAMEIAIGLQCTKIFPYFMELTVIYRCVIYLLTWLILSLIIYIQYLLMTTNHHKCNTGANQGRTDSASLENGDRQPVGGKTGINISKNQKGSTQRCTCSK